MMQAWSEARAEGRKIGAQIFEKNGWQMLVSMLREVQPIHIQQGEGLMDAYLDMDFEDVVQALSL